MISILIWFWQYVSHKIETRNQGFSSFNWKLFQLYICSWTHIEIVKLFGNLKYFVKMRSSKFSALLSVKKSENLNCKFNKINSDEWVKLKLCIFIEIRFKFVSSSAFSLLVWTSWQGKMRQTLRHDWWKK